MRATMRVDSRFTGNELALVLRDSGVRTGVCSGVGLGITLVTWVYVANRVAALERVALQRNIIAAAVFGVFFLVPVVRFMWRPGRLLVSRRWVAGGWEGFRVRVIERRWIVGRRRR